MIVPAHVWTPWFSLFGSNSGFDSLEECFEELTPQIYAIETGLSSDPAMNWRLSSLDKLGIISASDAHSPQKLGREACVFDTSLDYNSLTDAFRGRQPDKLLYTIEFFPEEGKYHFSGHRTCNVTQSPTETKEKGVICPVCGKRLTLGVMHRVEELADRPAGYIPSNSPTYKSLVPLLEVIAESLGQQVGTAAVENEYFKFTNTFLGEFNVLLEAPIPDLEKLNPKVAEGIKKMREGNIKVEPGYDGVFGKVSIWSEEEEKEEDKQTSLF